MEAKDLVLLMLIPIILISLVIYTNKNQVITGAVTAEEKQSSIIGTYSIMPSFKAKINYDLNDYNRVKKLLDFILKCAEDGKNIDLCMNQVESEDNNFIWSLDCSKGAEKVLYDFAEFLQNCFDSEDYNCICRKNLEMPKEKIQEYGLVNSKYTLDINEDTASKNIDITLSKINDEFVNFELLQNIETKGISGWIPKQYIIAYTNELFGLNMIFIGPDNIISGTLPQSREIIIYKSENNGNKSLDFVKEGGEELVYSQPGKRIKKPEGLDKCSIKPKNMHKFCVTKKDSKFMAYDKIDGQVKERPITIKFASYIPDLLPPPITGIEVYDKPKAENSIIIKWDKSIAEDVVKYNLYYGKSSFNIFEEAKHLSDIKKKEGFNKKEIDLTKIKPIEINEIKLDSCLFDFKRKGCVHKTENPEGIILEKEKLYYSRENNYYFYVLTLEDGIGYDLSVTAIDKNGNEIDNIKDKLPVLKNKESIDDLPINSKDVVLRVIYNNEDKNFVFPYDFRRKNKNIDDTDTIDFNYYKVYYYKFTNLDVNKISDIQQSLINKPLSESTLFFIFKPYPDKREPFKSPNTEIKNGEYYFFIIVAMDKNANPKQELKPNDVGIETPLRYPII